MHNALILEMRQDIQKLKDDIFDIFFLEKVCFIKWGSLSKVHH